MKKPLIAMATLSVIVAVGLGFAAAQAAVDWGNVAARDVTLFYPGQSSWEWALTPSNHPGAEKFRGGRDCADCHTGDERTMGSHLVSGQMNEPSPIAGKPGSIVAHVRFAHDAEKLYVNLQFTEGSQPNAGMDRGNATKVAMMIASAGFPEASRAGCWAMCHDDSRGMASAGNSNRTMYLPKTRAHLTRQGGGDELKPAADLASLRSSGYMAEYWQARLNPGAPASADNGIIFDRRVEMRPTNVSVDASYAGGAWSVTLSRRLNAGAGAVAIVPGRTYTVAFAIHSGRTGGRFHYVSLERSLVLDQGNANFVAVRQ